MSNGGVFEMLRTVPSSRRIVSASGRGGAVPGSEAWAPLSVSPDTELLFPCPPHHQQRDDGIHTGEGTKHSHKYLYIFQSFQLIFPVKESLHYFHQKKNILIPSTVNVTLKSYLWASH